MNIISTLSSAETTFWPAPEAPKLVGLSTLFCILTVTVRAGAIWRVTVKARGPKFVITFQKKWTQFRMWVRREIGIHVFHIFMIRVVLGVIPIFWPILIFLLWWVFKLIRIFLLRWVFKLVLIFWLRRVFQLIPKLIPIVWLRRVFELIRNFWLRRVFKMIGNF